MHRVGIIPFDVRDNAVALMFVTSQTRGRWILPKGKIKSGETHIEACHREAFEEAGVRGIVLEDFTSTVVIGKQTPRGVEKVPVTYYPYLVTRQEDDWPEKERRQRHWALIQDSERVVHREDYLALVRQFEALRKWITKAAMQHKSMLQEGQLPAP